jgi:hypothetical protein
MIFNGPSKNHGKLLVITCHNQRLLWLLKAPPISSLNVIRLPHIAKAIRAQQMDTSVRVLAPSGSQLPVAPSHPLLFKILEKVKPLSIEPQKAPKILKSPKFLESKL